MDPLGTQECKQECNKAAGLPGYLRQKSIEVLFTLPSNWPKDFERGGLVILMAMLGHTKLPNRKWDETMEFQSPLH